MAIPRIPLVSAHLAVAAAPSNDAAARWELGQIRPWFEMMMLRVWHALTNIGDGAVLMPCAVILFAWLISAPLTRRTGWCWLVAVLLVGGGVALSKMLYMISGWHPAGWNFIGLSGHAALSFLFWPSAGAIVTGRNRTGLRVATVGLGAGLALAISAASWELGYHSLSEVIVGALWGAMVATVFLLLTWRQAAEAPLVRKWMIASMLLSVLVAFGHEFPSKRVLSWIAWRVGLHAAVHTRTHMGPQQQLPK
ncbi:hypothetical protein [Rhodanobacter terrae]|uniref:Phosphatidic acid phosphatase type 2/haloperoxidase domain-containing protein n=1 Tax=Rhodanobacter terrae TaxID=418647 RepID=A0ABW0T1L1_9GAMM